MVQEFSEITSLPFTLYLALALLSITLSVITSAIRRPLRIATDIPPIWFKERRIEQARVVKVCCKHYFHGKVNDADGLRIELHESSAKKSRLNTISVRLAGIDAPEIGKYGFTSQPHAKDSLIFLKSLIRSLPAPALVYVEFLALDRFNRAICMVHLKEDGGVDGNVSWLMVREGFTKERLTNVGMRVFTAEGGQSMGVLRGNWTWQRGLRVARE
jgi:hypothetical protein